MASDDPVPGAPDEANETNVPGLHEAEGAVEAEGSASAADALSASVAEPAVMREPAPTTSAIQAVSRRDWTRGLIGATLAFVVLVGLGFAAATVHEVVTRTPAEQQMIDIQQSRGAQATTVKVGDTGTATLWWNEDSGDAVITVDGLPTIDADETFEIWVTADDTTTSSATFDADDTGKATVALDDAVADDQTVTITVEPAAGVPHSAPTSDPVVTVPTS